MWFLFQDVLSNTENNMINQSINPILQSILKVFYFFMVQYQYEYDEVICVCIQCNNCIKLTPCLIYETLMIDIIPFLSKPSCFIKLVYNGWYKQRIKLIFLLIKTFLVSVQEGRGIIKLFFVTYMVLYLRISLILHSKTYMNWLL